MADIDIKPLGGTDDDDDASNRDTGFRVKEATPIASPFVPTPHTDIVPMDVAYKQPSQIDIDTQMANAIRSGASAGSLTADTFEGVTGDGGQASVERYSGQAFKDTDEPNVLKKFDNNIRNAFKGLNMSGKIKSVTSKWKKFSSDVSHAGQMPLLSAIVMGGNPIAAGVSFMAMGLEQKKDMHNFLQTMSTEGWDNIISGPLTSQGGLRTWKLTAKNALTGREWIRRVAFEDFNSGADIKKNMKKYSHLSSQNALKEFFKDGMDKGVFSQDEIVGMASQRNQMEPGSDSYMKAWNAQKALKDKGWKVRGRVSINPQGKQYLDGIEWTEQRDLSGTVATKLAQPTTTTAEQTGKQVEREKKQPSTQPQIERPQQQQKPTASKGAYSGPRKYGRQEGGIVHLQEGGPLGNPMGEQENDAGNLEFVQEQGKDQSGVADDVPRELGEGDYVVNAPAVAQTGRGDLDRLVKRAKEELAARGITVDGDKEGGIDVRVSNGEYIIPKVIAEQIGYDRLEKINNRGKEKVDEIEKEQVQQQEQIQQNPQPEQQPQSRLVQAGGMISQTLDENENAPIAIPRETLSGQSSIGQQLVSPLSPKQQDEERELEKTSFEGFMKPIKMAPGGTVNFDIDKISDEEILTRMIYAEAGGEPIEGMVGVGNVIFNRMKKAYDYMVDTGIGDSTLKRIITATDQFTPFMDKNSKFYNLDTESKDWQDSLSIAKDLLSGKPTPDVTQGATFFYNPAKASQPYGSGAETKQIGAHKFLVTKKSGGMMAEGGITEPIESEEYQELTEEDMINLGVKAATTLALQNPKIKQNAEKFKNAIDLKLTEAIPNDRMRKYAIQLATEGMIKEEFDLPKGFKGEAGITKEGKGFLGANLSF